MNIVTDATVSSIPSIEEAPYIVSINFKGQNAETSTRNYPYAVSYERKLDDVSENSILIVRYKLEGGSEGTAYIDLNEVRWYEVDNRLE